MDAPEPEPLPPEVCVSCARPLKPGALFCSACGQRRGEPPVDRAALVKARVQKVQRIESGLSGIRSLILFYMTLLGGVGATTIVAQATDPFTAEAVGGAIIAGIVLFMTLLHRPTLRDCLRRAGFRLPGYLLLLAASFAIVVAVHLYVRGVDRLFRLHLDSEMSSYVGQSVFWAFLFHAVMPAVFEELAFRGVIFGLLRRSLDARESILLSAAAFGILHLSVPMLITHVPLGLYLGWLRHRSGSLYPSMAAHFLHNALVVAATTWDLFPLG